MALGRGTKSFYLAFLAIHLTVALCMVFSAKVVRNQVDELLNIDPGYNAKQILVIGLHGATQENVASIKELWSSHIKGHPFSYRFLDDYFQQHLEKEYAIKNLLIVFTFVSILIACIGIFGSINVRMEQSMKETGIRKILGGGMTQLLSANYREYAISIAIASLLAFPLSILIFSHRI